MIKLLPYFSAETFYDDIYYEHFRVYVNSEGMVSWSFGGVFHTSCELDTTFYPFDIQSCFIRYQYTLSQPREISVNDADANRYRLINKFTLQIYKRIM